MNKTIVLATSNANKLIEVKEVLSPLGFEVLSLKDLSLKQTAPEDGLTFVDNARIKAEDIASLCSYPVLSDDSGLCIEALDGFPGVHSARFMEGMDYKLKNQAIIEKMKGITDRRAYFACAMVYIDKKNGIDKAFEAHSEGEITLEVDPNPISGFGYDPIFYSYELKKTFGQASMEEKDKVSHRGKALLQVVEYLKGIYHE